MLTTSLALILLVRAAQGLNAEPQHGVGRMFSSNENFPCILEPLFTDDPVVQKKMFEKYKADYDKSYTTMTQEMTRYEYFLENLQTADFRNEKELRAGGCACCHGITQFSDWSQTEFERMQLMAYSPLPMSYLNASTIENEVLTQDSFPPAEIGPSAKLVDWTGVYTTEIKDQGQCGS